MTTKPLEAEQKNKVATILTAVYMHGWQTPSQSSDLPDGQMTIHQGVEEITSLLALSKQETLAEMYHPLKTVLDFVERWNKKDEEQDVAGSAHTLNEILSSLEARKG